MFYLFQNQNQALVLECEFVKRALIGTISTFYQIQCLIQCLKQRTFSHIHTTLQIL